MDLATLQIKVDSRQVEKAKRDLDQLGLEARDVSKDVEKIDKSSRKASGGLELLKKGIIALGGAAVAGGLIRISDQFTEIETKLRNVTSGTEEYRRVFDGLFSVAQKNGDVFAGLADTYNKLNVSLSEQSKKSFDLVKVTELLSRGFAAAGTNAQTAAGASLQLTQGLATDFQAAGQELNSIIEGAPLLANIIAKELGGTSAVALKKLAEEGKLTADTFLQALINAEEAIKAFDIPPTIGRSIQRVSNEFVRLIGESNSFKSLAGGLASSIDFIAEEMDTLFKLIGVAVGATIPLLIKQFAIALPAAIAATSGALTALTAIIAANPIGAIAVAISAAVSAFFLFRKEIFEVLREIKIFDINVTDIFFGIKNTAIEVFKSLVDILTLPFRIAFDAIASNFNRLKALANSTGLTNFEINPIASQNIADIVISNTRETFGRTGQTFNRAFENTKKDIEEFQKKGEEAGLLPDGNSGGIGTGDSPLGKELDKVKDKTKDLTKAFDDVTDGIIDAFTRGFNEGDGIIDSFINGTKNSFSNLFRDIAQIFAKPIGMKIIAGVAGGGAGAAAASAGGFSTSGFGGIGQTISSISSLLNSSGPITLGGLVPGGIGQSLGFAQALPAGTFGPAAPGSLFGGTTLGGALGGGAIGGLGAQLLGLGSGNALQDTAFGLTGTALGSFFGPIGAGVGSFLGTALGGLFGGSKPSNKSQFTGLNLETLESREKGLTGKKFSQENRDFANAVIDEASNLAALLRSAGATLSGSVGITVGSRDGIVVGGGGYNQGQNFGSNSAAAIQAVAQQVINNIADAPEDLSNVLKNVSGFDTKSIAEAIGILELVRSFEDAGKATQPLKDALDALDMQFKELADKATALGLPTDKLTESYERQKEALIDNILKPLQDFLDNQAMGGDSSLSPTGRLSLARQRFDENLSAINMGDFSNFNQITNQASELLRIGRDVFASGAGFTALESFVRQSISGIGDTLGAPAGSLNDSIARELTLSSAQQTSIQQQMLLELRELRNENVRLRKAYERAGNQAVNA